MLIGSGNDLADSSQLFKESVSVPSSFASSAEFLVVFALVMNGVECVFYVIRHDSKRVLCFCKTRACNDEGEEDTAVLMHMLLEEVSMCRKPVVAPSAVGIQWDGQLDGVFHLADDHFLKHVFLFWHDGEVQFVMYLKNHF